MGPSCPNCSLVLCTWPMKSMKPSPDLGTPCSGQSVNWNCLTVLDWPSWKTNGKGRPLGWWQEIDDKLRAKARRRSATSRVRVLCSLVLANHVYTHTHAQADTNIYRVCFRSTTLFRYWYWCILTDHTHIFFHFQRVNHATTT